MTWKTAAGESGVMLPPSLTGVDEDDMSEGTSLDELLNGPAEPVVETPQEPQVEATEVTEPETIGQPRDEHGRFVPKEETGVEAPAEAPAEAAQPVPPTEQTGLPPAEYAALKDERRKRQEAEARIAALEQQFQAMQPKATEEPEPDFWDNPQAVISKQFQDFKQQLREEMKQEQITERVDASEATARSKYTDFDEKIGAFRQAVQLNPRLAQEMAQHPDPAEFAYSRGKTALEIERHGSLDDLIKAERVKWEAEARAAMPAAPTLPSTTATDGSVGVRAGPAWAGPKPLDQILG